MCQSRRASAETALRRQGPVVAGGGGWTAGLSRSADQRAPSRRSDGAAAGAAPALTSPWTACVFFLTPLGFH